VRAVVRQFCGARGATRPTAQFAFTLIEVIISVVLMAIILGSAYACFDAGIRGKKMIEPRVEVFQNARVAMALITADLRDACPLSKDFDFLGTHRTISGMPVDNLDFATHNYTPTEERQADFCETSYYLNQDPTNGTFTLFRRRNPIIAPDPLSGGSQEEIATGLLGAQFEYFDGLDWYDAWGDLKGKKQTSNKDQPNMSGMPAAVRITLWFDPDPQAKSVSGQTRTNPPMTFQTVARLMLAESSPPSASSDSSGTGSSDQSNQGAPTGGVSQ
jgi:prepilin-type N-terminal cleavage/methylation domain-containing protein